MILQGRFGNSIRFGSTIDRNKVTRKNNWSNEGTIGSPITIISNGREAIPAAVEAEYEHTTENINSDKSSIWLCSNQQINNLEIASLHDLSYYYETEKEQYEEHPTAPNEDMNDAVEEDVPLSTADKLPPEELQITNELSKVQDTEVDYYDIAPTEQQAIKMGINTQVAVVGVGYIVPDTVDDSFLQEDINE